MTRGPHPDTSDTSLLPVKVKVCVAYRERLELLGAFSGICERRSYLWPCFLQIYCRSRPSKHPFCLTGSESSVRSLSAVGKRSGGIPVETHLTLRACLYKEVCVVISSKCKIRSYLQLLLVCRRIGQGIRSLMKRQKEPNWYSLPSQRPLQKNNQ